MELVHQCCARRLARVAHISNLALYLATTAGLVVGKPVVATTYDIEALLCPLWELK